MNQSDVTVALFSVLKLVRSSEEVFRPNSSVLVIDIGGEYTLAAIKRSSGGRTPCPPPICEVKYSTCTIDFWYANTQAAILRSSSTGFCENASTSVWDELSKRHNEQKNAKRKIREEKDLNTFVEILGALQK